MLYLHDRPSSDVKVKQFSSAFPLRGRKPNFYYAKYSQMHVDWSLLQQLQ
jgi:hypothetical protein